ncbi:MAG: hypothetical protein JWO09_1923 [Bacteroidetes bacterium]|nr:hypothetical protein [Bacteroidota bacterium]
MSSENLFNFEKLVVYQKSLTFIDRVYEVTEMFPASERFNLVDQFKASKLISLFHAAFYLNSPSSCLLPPN